MKRKRLNQNPIDPYWWVRLEERLARERWIKVELPFLRAQFDAIDKLFSSMAGEKPRRKK